MPRRKNLSSSDSSATTTKRTFHDARPIGHNGKNWVPVHPGKVVRDTRYQPPPAPPAGSDLHMDLAKVLPSAQMSRIKKEGKIAFHVNGDIGGIKDGSPQQAVADEMEKDVTDPNADAPPDFMYLVGDVVYYTGQASEYFSQFYLPYEHYPAPIFAIPGNHDGEFDPVAQTPSLQAFMNNFCAQKPIVTPGRGRPNVWP